MSGWIMKRFLTSLPTTLLLALLAGQLALLIPKLTGDSSARAFARFVGELAWALPVIWIIEQIIKLIKKRKNHS